MSISIFTFLHLQNLRYKANMSYHKFSGANFACKNEKKKCPVPLVWAGERKVPGKSDLNCGLK